MIVPAFRKFSVLDPAALVVVSREAEFALQSVPGEPVKLYQLQDSFALREMTMPEFEGIPGALNHKQFQGCTEAAIICDDCIRRYSLTAKQELEPIKNVSATAVAYNAGSTALFVAEESGKILVYVLDEDQNQPHLIHSFNSGHRIGRIFPHSFNDTFTAIGEGCLLFVDPLNNVVEVIQREGDPENSVLQVTAVAVSPSQPLQAIAFRPNSIYVTNFAGEGFFTVFTVDEAVTDMVFLPSGTELALVTGNEVLIGDLSQFVEPEGDDDIYFGFQPVMMPPASRIWAIRSVENQLRIVYE